MFGLSRMRSVRALEPSVNTTVSTVCEKVPPRYRVIRAISTSCLNETATTETGRRAGLGRERTVMRVDFLGSEQRVSAHRRIWAGLQRSENGVRQSTTTT